MQARRAPAIGMELVMVADVDVPKGEIEKRANDRIRSFLRAQIIFNNRMTTIECIIKNISATGARVALDETLAVPTEFDIYIPTRNRSHRARLVWRDKESIGVDFLEETQETASGLPPAQPESSGPVDATRLRELEDQNAQLKARIRRLNQKLEDMGFDPSTII
ncbi:MAG: PilZ domain-containing protein [Beijerinckiaceae bacterium]|nr:MAG: PilZ domain-containing protein [Beijerinckiaceae bacterium]